MRDGFIKAKHTSLFKQTKFFMLVILIIIIF